MAMRLRDGRRGCCLAILPAFPAGGEDRSADFIQTDRKSENWLSARPVSEAICLGRIIKLIEYFSIYSRITNHI
jgi:hypothetical protein